MVFDAAIQCGLSTQIAADLAGGVSVLLTGLPGSGRSQLARQVAGALVDHGVNPVLIRGNRLVADKALATLTLNGIGTEDPPVPGGYTLARAAAALGALAAHPRSCLIVDDADGLDPVSAGVITDLLARQWLPLLAVGPHWPGDGVVAELVGAAPPGVTVTLSGLALPDVTRLANALLGGVVGADTLSRLAAWSGGLPGLVTAILLAGRRNGRLVQRGGVWLVNGDLWDDALQSALLPFVRGLSAGELAGLVEVAKEPGRATAAPVERLMRLGLVGADPMGTTPDVHVFPPALGEWLRRTSTPGRAPDQAVTPATDLGRWPTNLAGPQAAGLADRLRTHLRAEAEAHWARWREEPTTARALPLLAALFAGAAGDDRIAVVLAESVMGTDAPADATFVSLAAVYTAVWEHDLAGGLERLRQYRAAHPAAATYLTGVECRLVLICDRVPDAALMAEPPGAPTGTDVLLTAQAEALIAQGRVRAATAVLARLEPGTEHVAVIKRTLEVLAQVLGDDVAAGVAAAVRHLRDAVTTLDSTSVAGYAYAAALGLCMLGRLDEVEAVVEVVHRLGDTTVFQNYYKSGLLLLGSFIFDWAGRRDHAHTLALQAKSLGLKVGPFPAMMAQHELLFTNAVTPEQMWDEVDDLLDRGYLTSAVYYAVAAIERDPGTTRAAAVQALGRASESRVLRALSRYVAAVNAGDFTGFGDVVADLRASCGPLDATRARITWALALRRAGDGTGWLEQTRAAWAESGSITVTCDGLFARLVTEVDLTAREAEVARLAAGGWSSPGIAQHLGVSPRTVEAYLQSVYRKTGVTSRDDLQELTTTWLTLPA